MIHGRFKLTLLISLTLTNLSPALLQAQNAPLVWKFAVGDEHHFQLNQQMNMTMNLGVAGTVGSTVKQVLDMVWRVEAVDDQGAANIVQRITRVQLDMQAPGNMELHYDTDSDDEPTGFVAMLAPTLKALQSGVFTTTMTPRGEITAVEVPKSVIDSMSGMPGGGMLGDLATQVGFKNMIQNNSLVLPTPAELQPGHEWDVSTKLENPQFGKVTNKTSYRYVGPREVEGEQLEIFTPRLEINFDEGPDGVKMIVESQETTGEIVFSRTHGRLQSSTIRQQSAMVLEIAGKSIGQRLDQTVELRRLGNDE